MVDSPDKIKDSLEHNIYTRQDYDVTCRIRFAISDKLNFTTVPYSLCEKLKKELKNKGYRVTEKHNWFFGDNTIVSW